MAYGSIDEIYQQLLGRAPDAGGQQFYGGLLSSGTGLDEIARQIGASNEAGSYRNGQQMAQLQQDMYNQGYIQPADGMGPMIPRELAQQGITQWSQYQPAAGGGGGDGSSMYQQQMQMQMQPWMDQYQQYQQQWANQMNQFSSQLGGLLGNLSAPAATTGANSSLVPASGTQSAPAASWKTGLLGTLANTANPWSY